MNTKMIEEEFENRLEGIENSIQKGKEEKKTYMLDYLLNKKKIINSILKKIEKLKSNEERVWK